MATSLRGLLPLSSTIIVFVSIACNVGLLIYSDLAVGGEILSNAPSARRLSGLRELSNSVACNESDHAFWDNRTADELVGVLSGCTNWCGFALLTDPSCAATCMESQHSITPTCAACFTPGGTCAASNCAFDCLGGPGPACVSCVNENCMASLLECTGFSDPNINADVYPPSPPASGKLVMHSIGADGRITYFQGVERAIQGQAYGIAVAIIACSGVWPYLSLLLFLFAWTVPLTARGRMQLLCWTNRFDRWALMDVMVVCLLVSYFNVDILNGELKLRSEARSSICTFAISGIWSIFLGTWIQRQAAKAEVVLATEEREPGSARQGLEPAGDLVHLGCCASPASTLDAHLHGPTAQAAFVPLSIASFGLMLASIIGPFCKLSLSELDPSGVEYTKVETRTIFEVAVDVLPIDKEYDHHQPAPAAFIGLVLIVAVPMVSLVCTFATACAASLVALFGLSSDKAKSALALANAVQPFATYDVFAVAVLVTTKEYELIIKSIAGAALGGDGNNLPMTAKGELDWAGWLMIPASILFWVNALLCASAGLAQGDQAHITKGDVTLSVSKLGGVESTSTASAAESVA
mmetsp:Transcript_32733/g.86024  ORF Transcript_32733/g.86024 Transcript_32733/m.86024 type:complete len:582 (+) Transcript_32733:81-1826(+)